MRGATRAGFTLPELLVAALLLQVGLLAAISLTAIAVRHAQAARGTEEVVSVLAGLADSLAVADSVSADSSRVDGVHARWRVTSGQAELRAWSARSDTVSLDVRIGGVARVP